MILPSGDSILQTDNSCLVDRLVTVAVAALTPDKLDTANVSATKPTIANNALIGPFVVLVCLDSNLPFDKSFG